MAAYPTLEVSDLAAFTGRPQASYPTPYSTQALAQATLLFRLATGLADWPDPTAQADFDQLGRYAILEMADAFVLAQPFKKTLASPFQSETIGSYSYTKVARALQAGMPTGVFWFDLAVQRMGISEDVASVVSDSAHMFDLDLTIDIDVTGVRRVFGPADLNPIDVPYTISRPVAFDPSGF